MMVQKILFLCECVGERANANTRTHSPRPYYRRDAEIVTTYCTPAITKTPIPNSPYNQQEIDIILKNFSSKYGTIQKIRHLLPHRSYESIRSATYRLGLTVNRKHPDFWTPEKIDRAYNIYCEYGMAHTAKVMGKSQASIKHAFYRAGLNLSMYDGWYFASHLCDVFGMNYAKIMSLINSGALIASREGKLGYWIVRREDLNRFIRRYPLELSNRKLDMVQILTMLGINMTEQ